MLENSEIFDSNKLQVTDLFKISEHINPPSPSPRLTNSNFHIFMSLCPTIVRGKVLGQKLKHIN